MLVSDIKSRPQYQGLVADPHARRHLIAAEGEGAVAVREAFADRGAASRATILYTAGGSAPAAHERALEALRPDLLYVLPSVPTLLTRLRGVLATANMGDRLYATGTEGFIGQIVQLGLEHGMDHQAIRTEHRGSLARRVQCVHCKGITENVRVSPVRCAHCGIALLVRDHYSRRLGAFMGVSIDAEAPGEVPPAEELYA